MNKNVVDGPSDAWAVWRGTEPRLGQSTTSPYLPTQKAPQTPQNLQPAPQVLPLQSLQFFCTVQCTGALTRAPVHSHHSPFAEHRRSQVVRCVVAALGSTLSTSPSTRTGREVRSSGRSELSRSAQPSERGGRRRGKGGQLCLFEGRRGRLTRRVPQVVNHQFSTAPGRGEPPPDRRIASLVKHPIRRSWVGR